MFESGVGGDFATYVGAATGSIYRMDLAKIHYQGILGVLGSALLSACQNTATAPSEVKPPEIVHREAPVYPAALRKADVTGKVVFQFIVEKDGTVQDVVIVTSPDKRFSHAVVSAVRGWRFKPAVRDGVPVRYRVGSDIDFALIDDPAPTQKK